MRKKTGKERVEKKEVGRERERKEDRKKGVRVGWKNWRVRSVAAPINFECTRRSN